MQSASISGRVNNGERTKERVIKANESELGTNDQRFKMESNFWQGTGTQNNKLE